MSELIVRCILFLSRRRAATVAACAAVGLASLLLGRGLKLEEDYTGMLPMGDPAIAGQVEALKRVRQAERLFFDIQSVAGDSELLVRAGDRLNELLAAMPELSGIRYSFDAADAGAVLNGIEEDLPWLLSAGDLRKIEPKLAPEAIENRLAWFKRSLGQPQGLALGQAARLDPAGVGDLALQRLRALQAGMGEARMEGGHIVSADGRHLLLTAEPVCRSSDLKRSRPVVEGALSAARSVEAEFPGVRVAVAGAHRMALDNADMIRRDTERTSFLATVAVLALMAAAYRHRWFSLLSLAPTVFGAAAATLYFYLAGDAVSAVALGCGSILIGVTVDYGIYVLYHADDRPPESREELARRVAGLAPTLAFGALTTMAAFFIMLLSPVSGHRQLGMFSALGVFGAMLFSVFVLPAFVPVKAAQHPTALPLTRWMERLEDASRRRRRELLILMGILTIAAAAGATRLRFDGDLARLNGAGPTTLADERSVRETWGSEMSLTVVVADGATREQALEMNERVEAFLRQPETARLLESHSSIAAICPSEATRRANRAAWAAFWTPERRAGLSNALAEASAKMGFRMEAFAPFLGRVAAPAAGANGGLDVLLREYINERDGRVAVSTLIKLKDRADFPAFRAALGAAVPQARVLNKAALGDDISRTARRGLPAFGAMVAALNALLLFLYLARVELVLIALAPMAAGVFWTLGLMGLAGMPIDLSNFIFVIFVIGVGGDYSLFLLMAGLERLRGRAGQVACTGGAVTICAGTTLLGVGVLVLARHPALFSVGLTALLGITLSWLAALLLVPMGLEALRRRQERPLNTLTLAGRREAVLRMYRYQGAYASQYAYWKLRMDPMFEALDREALPTGRILDVGCGFGLAAHWLTINSPGREVFGMDMDYAKIDTARATEGFNPRVRFKLGNALTDDFPKCQAVLICDVLHYFPRELKLAVLRKAAASLAPGGKLIIRDGFADGQRHAAVAFFERLAVRLRINKTAHGLHFETQEAFQGLLEEAGFAGARAAEGAGLGSNRLLTAVKAQT